MQGQAVLHSSASVEWATPADFFAAWHAQCNFELDAAADHDNAKVGRYYTKDGLYLCTPSMLGPVPEQQNDLNGLTGDWVGWRTWCNPPYGRDVGKWVTKAASEWARGAQIVMLLPARTDTRWFHDHLYRVPGIDVIFIKGRLKFGDGRNSAPFPSMVAVMS